MAVTLGRIVFTRAELAKAASDSKGDSKAEARAMDVSALTEGASKSSSSRRSVLEKTILDHPFNAQVEVFVPGDASKLNLSAASKVFSSLCFYVARCSLDALLADRTQRLARYQNAAYAARYETFVREIAALEEERVAGNRLARTVAASLYKLMAYKDEYEVARLFVETGFAERVARQFEGDYRLRFHLAPPLFSRRDAHGHLVKQAYGPWMLTAYKWLARARGLRGTPFDPFGYLPERRAERAAIGGYEALMRRIVATLTPARLPLALELARLPQEVRGFGHVKEENARIAHIKQERLLAQYAEPPGSASPQDRQAPHAVA